MYPGKDAATTPGKVAALAVETGESMPFGELDERSVRLAHVLHAAGLRRGDVVALLSENSLRVFEVFWAAMRSGLYLTSVNHNLSPHEARSEEHTSELQSHLNLVCRLLLEKKKKRRTEKERAQQ